MTTSNNILPTVVHDNNVASLLLFGVTNHALFSFPNRLYAQ